MTTTTLTDKLTAIADAVRTKTGSTDTMTLDTMAREISNMEVHSSLSDSLINRSITKYSSDTLTSIGSYAFSYCSSLVSVDTPNITTIGSYAFYYCTSLTSVDLSSIKSIGSYAFNYCTSLTSFDLSIFISIGSLMFRGCTGLSKVWIPSTCTTIYAPSVANSPFYNCSSTLEIYTDVADEDSIPSGWGTYWNYYASGSTLTVHYGATHDEYEAA